MTRVIVTLLLNALVVLVVARVTPGVRIKNFGTALAVAVVYGGLSFLLKWLLVLLTAPLIILTLGLFLLVVNAFLLWMTDKLIDDFEIDGLGPLVLATLGISLGQTLVGWLV